jgi:DNA-binding MarR family transcriptional regulator
MSKKQIVSLAEEINRDLHAVRHTLRQPLEAEVARGGLTGPQQSAMRALVQHEGMSLRNLSKELGLAHSIVSGIVDRLEKQGLVSRRADEADLRISKIVVSTEVRDYLRNRWPSLEMHPLAKALRAASPAEREEVAQGLRTLRRLLEGVAAKAPRPQ